MATASISKRLIARILLLAALFAIVWFVQHRRQIATEVPTPKTTSTSSGQQGGAVQHNTPAYALEVLDFVRRNGHSPDGYVGGKEFLNREKRLPAKSQDGKRIRYSEWDVHPKETGKNRGPERLVTGSDHSAWYTKNHYKTFQKIE